MIVYDVIVNGEQKETIEPCCQCICEIFEWGNSKIKELIEKYQTNNVEMNRRYITQ